MGVPEPQSSATPPPAPSEKTPALPANRRRAVSTASTERKVSANRKSSETPPPRPVATTSPVEEEDPPFFLFERTFWVRFWEHLNGEAGAGYLLSFVFHMVLLALLAVPIIQEMRQQEEIVTILAGGDELPAPQGIGESIDVGVALANLEPPPSNGSGSTADLLQFGEGALMPIDVNPDELSGLKSKSSGKGVTASDAQSGGGKGGPGGSGTSRTRAVEPSNAIKAGSFSVWSWPIVGKDLKGNLLHADPGASPRIFQDYHIVIRVKVAEGLKHLTIGDFSGNIVGTDGYKQKIPDDAWYYNLRGDLNRVRTGQMIPVIDGTVEVLIRVPSAGRPQVKDTIVVNSRSLNETQTITLEFVTLDQQVKETMPAIGVQKESELKSEMSKETSK